MKNLNVKFVRSYRSQKGNVTFVYSVSGSEANLAKYKEVQGDFFREDEGKALWFTTRFIGNTGKLIITEKDKVVPDMAAFDQAASLASQYGGNLGTELAKTAATQLLSGGNTPSNQSVSTQEETEASADNLGKH